MRNLKKSELSPSYSITEILLSSKNLFYFVFTSLLWIVIVSITTIYFYNASLSEHNTLNKIDSIYFIFYALYLLIFIGIVSIGIGLVLSLPSIFLNTWFDYQIQSYRKKYKPILSLTMYAHYLPIVLLICVNIAFYAISLSEKIENEFLSHSRLKKVESNYQVIGSKNPNGYFIFLLPKYLLDDENKLQSTKSVLQYTKNIFLESSSKPELVSLLINEVNGIENQSVIQYHIPTSTEKNSFNNIPQQKLLLGLDSKDMFSFLPLFRNNIVTIKKDQLTKSALIANRILAAVKPAHLIVKLGVTGFFNENLKWENLSNNSLDVLFYNSSALMRTGSATYTITFLSDLEKKLNNNLLVSLSDSQKKYDASYLEQKLDLNLLTTIQALMKSGAKNIILLPYETEATPNFITMSKFFTTMDRFSDDENSNLIESYRTLLHNLNEEITCRNQYISTNKNYSDIIADNIRFSKKGIPYLEEEFNVYIKSTFSTVMTCYEGKKNIYILTKDMDLKQLDINRITGINNRYTLNLEEKNNFTVKYQHAIFK